MLDWRDVFCGRKAELKQLVDAYESVAAVSGPRLAVVCAERGMGKTRLVQELYRHLSTACDPDDYWPDASLFKGNNLRVAPDFNDPETQAHFASFTTSQRPMPFLWWGFRLNDPLDRNAVRSDMAGHRRTLDPHLERARFASEQAAKRSAIKHSAQDTAKDAVLKIGEALLESVPGVGLGKNLIEIGVGVFKTARSHAEARQQADQFAIADLASLEQRRKEDIYQRTLEDLAAVLKPARGVNGVPAVVFCDDAQFAREGGDEGVLRFLEHLWHLAEEGKWPLLLVATHWAIDWEQDRRGPSQTFARAFSEVAADARRSTVIQLTKESDLEVLVEQGLPDFPRQDIDLLLRKVDGNPQVLIELVGRIQASPAWRDRQGGLSPHGRKQIEEHSCNLTTLITERLLSDATPTEVRLAVALSSLQGMQFSCPLTEAAANAMQLGAVGSGISAAAHPLRLVVGVDAGIANFVQRAYRDAARSLVPTELGDPQEVKEGLLAAAIALVNCEESWNSFAPPQKRALMGVVASLGAESADRTRQTTAGRALIRLIELEQDCACKAHHARAFTEGLGRLWSASQFDEASIGLVRAAIEDWDGFRASYTLDKRLLDALRAEQPVDFERAGHLTKALLLVAAHERWLGNHDEASTLVDEAIRLAKTPTGASHQLNESDLAETLELAADPFGASYEQPELARKLRHEALELRRARFQVQHDEESCEQFVTALNLFAIDCEPRDAAAVRQEAVMAARSLSQQVLTDEARRSAAIILGKALIESMSSVFTHGSVGFRVPPAGECEEALPRIAELMVIAGKYGDWRTNEEDLVELINLSAVGALVANRAGNRELAESLFRDCKSFVKAAAVELQPEHKVSVRRILALMALFEDDIRSAYMHASDAVGVALQNRNWWLLEAAMAFELRLRRHDLQALLEPDPTEDDEAAVLPELLAAMRQALPEWVGVHTEAERVFSFLKRCLSLEVEHQRLDPNALQVCVGEARLLMSQYEAQHDRATRPDDVTESWLSASLAFLCLATRASREDDFEWLWELAPRLLHSVLQSDRSASSLNIIYNALDDLCTVLWELQPDRVSGVQAALVDVARRLVARTADPSDRRSLAYQLTMLAFSRMGVDDLAEADSLVTESLAIAFELVADAASLANLNQLGRCLATKETLARRLGDQAMERDAQVERLRTLERIVALGGDEEHRDNLEDLSRTLRASDRASAVLH